MWLRPDELIVCPVPFQVPLRSSGEWVCWHPPSTSGSTTAAQSLAGGTRAGFITLGIDMAISVISPFRGLQEGHRRHGVLIRGGHEPAFAS